MAASVPHQDTMEMDLEQGEYPVIRQSQVRFTTSVYLAVKCLNL